MQEQVRQERRDDPSLRRSGRARHDAAGLHLHRRLQPTLNIKQYPWAIRMLTDRLEEQLPVDAVERRHDRLPITKTIRIRSSSLVNGMYLKGVGSLSSGASQDGVFLSFL